MASLEHSSGGSGSEATAAEEEKHELLASIDARLVQSLQHPRFHDAGMYFFIVNCRFSCA